MRTNVWAMLRRYDESLDKVEQYVSEILWHQRDFLQLLSLRVKASVASAGIKARQAPAYVSEEEVQERLLEAVFVPKMEWAGKSTHTYKVIYTLSYERPRWAIQLCKLAQEAALRRQLGQITKETIDEVWGEYGAKRIADLVSEHKHQCPQVEELLNGFRGCERLLTRAALFTWVNNRITNHLEVRIEGDSSRSPKEIARFLYRIGFIVARSENEHGDYEHYRFDQMPDFLSARTDEDFNVKWEIHPCYREALDIKKLDRSHRQRFSQLRAGERRPPRPTKISFSKLLDSRCQIGPSKKLMALGCITPKPLKLNRAASRRWPEGVAGSSGPMVAEPEGHHISCARENY